MKSSNTVVSVIVIVAVLVFSYAVGLLIRQARTGARVAPPPAAGSELPTGTGAPLGPGEARTKDTAQERARLKDQKAKAIEQMNALTEEQKEKFRHQVHQQVGSRRGGAGLESPSPPLRPAGQVKAPSSSPADPANEDVNSPAPRGENR